MTTHACRFLSLALLGILLLSTGCQAPAETDSQARPELAEVPAPDLTAAQETVKEQIAAGVRRVESLGQRETPAADLAEAYGDLGLVYLTYSFLEAAEACFFNARLLIPDDSRWPYLLGYLFQVQGRLEEAETVLARALELEPGDRTALIRLGTVRLELGDPAGAKAHFQRVVELDPSSAAGLNGLGRVAAAQGDPGRAVELFERALELQPQASSIRHALGLAYRALGDREQARRNLERGGDAPVLFVDPKLRPVSELGRSAEIYLVRGAQAFSEERYAQAAESYRRALEIDPTDFTTYKALGFCLEKLGDLDGAIAQLDAALVTATTGDRAKDDMEHSEVLRIMGGLRVLQGRDQEAISRFERALALDPDRLDPRLKLANALARNRRFDEAIEHFDRVLQDSPDDSNVLMKRATSLINLGRLNEAVADFEKAIAASSSDPALRLRFAEALEFIGQAARAKTERQNAARIAATEGDRSPLLLSEARSLTRQGKLEAAIAKLGELLAQDGDNNDARFEMASLLGHLGRYEHARREFAQVVKDFPYHGPARHGEVTALLLLGRYQEARQRLEDGIAALPRDRGLAHALARLLAIAPLESVRDGVTALHLSRQLEAVGATPETAATLAMALAAAGRFEEAAAVQRRLISEIEATGPGKKSEILGHRLSVFETRRVWEARSPDEIIAVIVATPAGDRSRG